MCVCNGYIVKVNQLVSEGNWPNNINMVIFFLLDFFFLFERSLF